MSYVLKLAKNFERLAIKEEELDPAERAKAYRRLLSGDEPSSEWEPKRPRMPSISGPSPGSTPTVPVRGRARHWSMPGTSGSHRARLHYLDDSLNVIKELKIPLDENLEWEGKLVLYHKYGPYEMRLLLTKIKNDRPVLGYERAGVHVTHRGPMSPLVPELRQIDKETGDILPSGFSPVWTDTGVKDVHEFDLLAGRFAHPSFWLASTQGDNKLEVVGQWEGSLDTGVGEISEREEVEEEEVEEEEEIEEEKFGTTSHDILKLAINFHKLAAERPLMFKIVYVKGRKIRGADLHYSDWLNKEEAISKVKELVSKGNKVLHFVTRKMPRIEI